MSIRSTKRVSFVEQDLSQEDILEIQKENYLLRGKLFELEQFCEKAEKSFNQSAQKTQLIEELSNKNKELLIAESEYKEQIIRLQSENRQILQENQKFKLENNELLMKKQILEGEVERLSESVYNFEMQLKKVGLGKVSNAGNPNYASQKLQMGTLKIPDEVNLRRISVEGGSRNRENRTKLAESHIAKMKNLAGLNYSCKNISSQQFSFTSPGTSPKGFQQTSNVEELKKLIRQAKENHLKLKSTF